MRNKNMKKKNLFKRSNIEWRKMWNNSNGPVAWGQKIVNVGLRFERQIISSTKYTNYGLLFLCNFFFCQCKRVNDKHNAKQNYGIIASVARNIVAFIWLELVTHSTQWIWWSLTSEHDRMNGTKTNGCQHGHHCLRYQGHINDNTIAFFHTQSLQTGRQSRNLWIK